MPAPEHPMLSVHTCRSAAEEKTIMVVDEPVIYSSDFYMISFKKFISGEIHYGRTKYDFTNGLLLFTAPRQEMRVEGVVAQTMGTTICFHEDFVKGHDIRDRIKKYSYFSYAVNEALHLSPREEKLIESILANIEVEYHTNPDEFSKDIILSCLDTLLKYANRYYKRQFVDRREMSGEILSKFENILTEYFESGEFERQGIPNVEEIAKKLGMTPRYLSDSLKAETGKRALDHIHLYLLDEAKNILLRPNITVAETAYQLGFEYPSYFSRLFKKKIGVSPVEYQKRNLQ